MYMCIYIYIYKYIISVCVCVCVSVKDLHPSLCDEHEGLGSWTVCEYVFARVRVLVCMYALVHACIYKSLFHTHTQLDQLDMS
jgi:hypothetical protein